jgi:hypothetical protein
MAGFSPGPDDVTTRLNDIIEHLESVALQERADPCSTDDAANFVCARLETARAK